MKYRKKFLPRTLIDIASFIFISLMVPFGYCFGVFYVLPHFYPPTSFWYILHAFLASFVMVNIVGNFLFIMITDTSVKSVAAPPEPSDSHLWSYCSVCEARRPPRGWHCTVCNTCILKRDHHCQFTGCCVGHKNHRYFIFFLLYMVIGTIYGLFFHTRLFHLCTVKNHRRFYEFHGTHLVAFLHSLSFCAQHYFVLFYGVTAFGVGLSGFFLFWHWTTIIKGMVIYERARNLKGNDAGSLRANVEQVLGKRWYLAWISPLVPSPLPGDGFHWREYDDKRII